MPMRVSGFFSPLIRSGRNESPRNRSMGFMLLVPPLQMIASIPPASSMTAISMDSS